MDTRLHVVKWGAGQPRKRTSVAYWREPLKWDAERARAISAGENPPPHRVFCASLADVFDNEAPDEWRADLFALIRATPNLTWMLLTKRIGNADKMIAHALIRQPKLIESAAAWPWPNVWIGATICNQEEADRDVPKLLALPAAVRFVSIEPMLGAIDLSHINKDRETNELNALRPDNWEAEVAQWKDSSEDWREDFEDHYGVFPETVHGDMHNKIDWVICGGESGKDARPMHPDWARSLRDQCASAGVPFFFKQWGEWSPAVRLDDLRKLGDEMRAGKAIHVYGKDREPDGHFRRGDDHLRRIGTNAAGNLLDGKTWMQFPDEEKK